MRGKPNTIARSVVSALLVSVLGMTLALVVGRGMARRIAAERVAEVLVDAVPTEGLVACREGAPKTMKASEALSFDFYSSDGAALSPGSAELPAGLLSSIGNARSAATSEPRGAKMLLRLEGAGPCAYAQATWSYQRRGLVTSGTWLLVTLIATSAALGASGTLLVARPLVDQLGELRRAANSLARPRSGADVAPYREPRLVLEEARDVVRVLAEADARIAESSARLFGRSETLEALLGELTHDIATPLASLQFALDEIAEVAPEAALPGLRRALSDVVYVKSLTDNLRLAERLAPEGAALRLEELDVGEVVRAVSDRAGPFALRRGIELDVAAIPKTTVRGEPIATERALTNLLENAIAYGAPGTRVSVLLRGDELVVEDDGPGVRPEDLPKLGQRRFRGARDAERDRVRSRDGKGSGLGLSIVQEVCERSGWGLRFSIPEGGGFRAEITFRRMTSGA